MELLSSSPTDSVLGGASPVAAIGVEARLAFLRKTYALFTAGVGVAAVGAFAGMTVLTQAFRGVSPLFLFLGYIAAFFVVNAVRKTPVLNVVALLGFTFLSGLLTAPYLLATLAAKGMAVGLTNIMTAFVGSTVAFGGLTAYTFISRKDFSYLGGFLAIGLFGLLGFGLCSIFFSFSPGTWLAFDLIGLGLMSAFVLYDTSMILHHYAEDEYVLAALALYLDFILIFKYLLRLLNSRK